MTMRIVVGVDGSDHGNAALRWAVSEAEFHKGEILAVFAWQLPLIAVPGAFDRDEMERLCRAFVEGVVARVVTTTSVPITTLVAEGDVSASLIEAAKTADWCWGLGAVAASLVSNLVRSAKSARSTPPVRW